MRATPCVFVLFATAIAGCGAGGAATPEAALDGFKNGMASKDFGAAFGHLTPGSQDVLLEKAIDAAVQVSSHSESCAEQLDAVLQKHGLELQDQGPDFTADVSDKSGLFGELRGVLLSAVEDEREIEVYAGRVIAGDLEDLKLASVTIEGDKASGSAGGQPIHFARIDGQWFIDMQPLMQGAAEEPDEVPLVDGVPVTGDGADAALTDDRITEQDQGSDE